MELGTWYENNVSGQSLQPRTYDYSFASSASPPVRQQESEKTKAEPGRQTASDQRNDMDKVMEQANKLMELFNRDLRFETHEKTGMLQISIIDRKDGKVIKQIPPDSVLKMVARIQEILGGLLDVKV